jgi:hypothetical protein
MPGVGRPRETAHVQKLARKEVIFDHVVIR